MIALVVTIIILLILAGVSISVLGGENGLITKTIRAQEESKKAEYKEKVNLIIQEEQMNKLSKKDELLFIDQLEENFRNEEWIETITICNKDFKEPQDNETKEIIIINTKDGYEITIKVDNTRVTAEIISIIKGKTKTYKVTYFANNGTNEKREVEVREGFSTEIIENPYEKSGYEFVGWSIDKDATEKVEYVQGNKIENIKEDIDLYAIWSRSIATITFHGNGKTYTQTVNKNTETPLASYSQTGINYTGYAFTGWSETEGGSVKYADGATVEISADINLYGIFEKDSVTVSLSAFNGENITSKLTKGTTISISATSTKSEITSFKLEMIKDNNVVATIYQDTTSGTTKNKSLDATKNLSNLNKLTILNNYICRLTATSKTGATAQKSINLTDYTVASANDLAVLAQKVNSGATTCSGETITVTNNIKTSANYIPIGYYDGKGIFTGPYFAGIFDGNNYTIEISSMTKSSTYGSTGIFGMVIGGEIKNLNAVGVNDSSQFFSAGIVGVIKDGKISNCTNDCDLIEKALYSRAGISGCATNSEIKNCKNTGTIYGSYYVGGICGEADCTKINNCTNSQIIHSFGSCTVTWAGTASGVYGSSGGIAGYANNSEISNCNNSSYVRGGNENGTLTGGIVGVAKTNTKITLCRNTGNMEYYLQSGTSKNGGALGGIVGLVDASSIEQCYNKGNIQATFINGNRSMGQLGGIVGYGDTATLKNCYNLNLISGYSNIGGIIGYIKGGIINNCYSANTNISGTAIVGGFAGWTVGIVATNVAFPKGIVVFGSDSGSSWNNYAEYTITEMQTLNSGLLTIMNTGDGAGLWAQSSSKNDGFPYLINVPL